jgi:hypothetical protein
MEKIENMRKELESENEKMNEHSRRIVDLKYDLFVELENYFYAHLDVDEERLKKLKMTILSNECKGKRKLYELYYLIHVSNGDCTTIFDTIVDKMSPMYFSNLCKELY